MLAWVDLYNETVQILRDAIVSGQNLDYLKIVNSGVADRVVKGTLPALTVWPTLDPNEVWVALPDVRQGIFTVSITIMQETAQKAFPFGRSSPRVEGLLITAAEVMNEMDAARDRLCAAVPDLTDYDVAALDPIPIGPETVWTQELMVRYKYRVKAGQR